MLFYEKLGMAYNCESAKVNIPTLKGVDIKTTLIAVARISHVFCDGLCLGLEC